MIIFNVADFDRSTSSIKKNSNDFRSNDDTILDSIDVETERRRQKRLTKESTIKKRKKKKKTRKKNDTQEKKDYDSCD